MHKLETLILNIFKSNPEKEYSTTEIVETIFPETTNNPNIPLSRETLEKQKKQKAQNHRKLLYHINKLVNDGILKTTKVQAKGEKCFTIAIEEGEIIVGKGHKKIIISKSSRRSTPIEGYEKEKIVQKIGGGDWAGQLNCIILEAEQFNGLNNLYSSVVESFANLNDCIAINGFEKFFEKETNNIKKFLEKLDNDTNDYGKKASLLVELENCGNRLEEFAKMFAEINPKNISMVFGADSKSLAKKSKIMEIVAETFSEKTIKINIKNNSLQNSPIIVGNAGIYSIDEQEWKNYKKTPKKIKGVCISQNSMIIDFHKFFEKSKNVSEFRKLILNCLKSLVMANTQQRRKSSEYFKHIEELNKENPKIFFSTSRNYIRIWNFDIEKDEENTIAVLQSCKELSEKFCKTQETIFQSCGIPSRFRVCFSSAFKKYSPETLSQRAYNKTTITNLHDFFEETTKKRLKSREELFNIFEGSDRVRFFRAGNTSPKDVVREISTLLSSFNLPFFCYDFAKLKGRVKLTDFM